MANILQFLAIAVCLLVLAVQAAPLKDKEKDKPRGQILELSQGQDESGSYFQWVE